MTASPEIASIRPISRTAEDHLDAKGRRVHTRVFGPANPHYYADELGALRPIEIERVEDTVSAKAGMVSLRSKNVVSSGLRKDGNPEKYLGLRPDDCQALNTESLEFSLISVVLDGEEKKIELTAPRILDAVTQDLGSIIVQSTRRFTRQMVPLSSPIKDFRIEFALHLKGLTPFYRADLDEYWLYNAADEFRFRIVRPEVIDHKTGDPLCISEDELPLQNQIRHSLTANEDGTWSYVKTPGRDFSPDLWPETVWLDGTIVYSTTDDGRVRNYRTSSNWTTVQGGTTGDQVDTSATSTTNFEINYISATAIAIHRIFFYFDVSGLTGTVESATSGYYGLTYSGENNVLQGSDQGNPLAFADYNNCTGAEYARLTWEIGKYNIYTLNAAGITDLNALIGSGVFRTCLRNSRDYDNIDPGVGRYRSGLYFSDNTGTDNDPYLEITWATTVTLTVADTAHAIASEAPALVQIHEVVLTDNAKFLDALTTQFTGNISLADTLKLSDVLTTQFTGGLSLADTLKLSDSFSVGQLFDLLLSDSIKLSDSFSGYVTVSMAFADTITLSDSFSVGKLIDLLLLDSVKFSDSFSVGSLFLLNFSDTIALSDSMVGNLTMETVMADIAKLSDLATTWVLGKDAGIEFIANSRNYYFESMERNYFFIANSRNYYFTTGG